MGSMFDEMARESADMLVEQFGEQAEIEVHPPGRSLVGVTGAILGPERVDEVADDQGDLAKRITREVRFQKSEKLPAIELKTQFVIAGVRWAVQQTGSEEKHGWLIYQLERKPLTTLDPKRNARTV